VSFDAQSHCRTTWRQDLSHNRWHSSPEHRARSAARPAGPSLLAEPLWSVGCPLRRGAAVMSGPGAPRSNRFAPANPRLVAGRPAPPRLASVWSPSSITSWIHFSHVHLIDRALISCRHAASPQQSVSARAISSYLAKCHHQVAHEHRH